MNAAAAIFLAVLAAGALSFLEWRRPDRRHLVARVGATFLAVAALALLGWRPTWPRSVPQTAGRGEAVLWTPGAPLVKTDFTLPGAMAAPPGAMVLPDVGTLRRRFPAVGTLHVYGDGLDAFDLEPLRGLRVVFHPASGPLPEPAFCFMRCPRELPLGDGLTVQGSVGGLPPGKIANVILEAPDGTTTAAATAPAGADGSSIFSVNSAPPPAAGHFLWHLRLGKTSEALGVAVLPPDLPRVLVLAGAPRFDTALLRHWFEGAGGTLAARTLIGQERYRFESAHDPPPQFAALDAPLLAGYDLVLADGHALAALPPPERAALQTAVADTGLGLLVLADDATLPDAPGVPPEVRTAFFPWKLSPLTDATGEGDRLTRLGWPGQTRPIEIPLPCAPFEIEPRDDQTPLVHDGQEHTLAAAMPRGRGRIGLTLVRETGRWTRGNDPAAFAAYWSALFSPLARKTANAGRWTLLSGEAGPVFVDQPLELVWSGPPTPGPRAGSITAGETATLPLAQDPDEPGRWQGTYWPCRDGWHRVSMPSSGTALDFYVNPAGDWPALAAARRRAATTRFAVASTAGTTAPAASAAPLENAPMPLGGAFVLFLAGASYLWVERRQTA